MVIPDLHKNLYSHQNDIILIMSAHVGSIMRFTQVTGGGRFRCILDFQLESVCWYVALDNSQGALAGSYGHPSDPFFRQNAAHPFPWQNGISYLSYYWQHPKGYLSQAIMSCPDADWVHSNYKTDQRHQQGWTSPCTCQPLSFMHGDCTKPDQHIQRNWNRDDKRWWHLVLMSPCPRLLCWRLPWAGPRDLHIQWAMP